MAGLYDHAGCPGAAPSLSGCFAARCLIILGTSSHVLTNISLNQICGSGRSRQKSEARIRQIQEIRQGLGQSLLQKITESATRRYLVRPGPHRTRPKRTSSQICSNRKSRQKSEARIRQIQEIRQGLGRNLLKEHNRKNIKESATGRYLVNWSAGAQSSSQTHLEPDL